jgi:hypothetical protein
MVPEGNLNQSMHTEMTMANGKVPAGTYAEVLLCL